MAFDDILTAIVAHTDELIAQAKKAHLQLLTDLKAQNETQVQVLEQSIAEQKEVKKASMLQKAKTHSEALVKNADLQAKQDLLDKLFEQVLTYVTQLPKEDTTTLLTKLVARLPKEGVIYPSKAHKELLTKLAPKLTTGETINVVGGFIFKSPTMEQDCTFEHIVTEEIRQQSEVQAASKLFV